MLEEALLLLKKRNLASDYCAVGQPPEYRRRCHISQPSAGWDLSGSMTLKTPRKLIGFLFIWEETQKTAQEKRKKKNKGQALGLLVLLDFTCHHASI